MNMMDELFIGGMLILIIVGIIISYSVYKYEKRERKLKEINPCRLENYKKQHGFYQDPKKIKDHCPRCGSKNVKHRASHRFYYRTVLNTDYGGSTSLPVDESVYTCTCKDCGHVWQNKI